MAQVTVTIDPAGEVKVEALGVTGSGCKALTESLEKAIGSTTHDLKKPEFLQTAKQAAPQQVQQ